MKRIFLIFAFLLLTLNVYAADSTVANLTEDTSPGTDSLLYCVDDPAGTPVDRKCTVGKLLSAGTDLDENGVITANSVALGTDTTGNYVASCTNGTGISGCDSGSETANLTLSASLGTTVDYSEIALASSSQLAGIITNETGSGSLVFQNTATMTGLTVNTLTGGSNGKIELGTLDPSSRTQIWNYETNSILRLGALSTEGDSADVSSEGIIIYGANRAGETIDISNYAYARIKPDRFGLYEADAPLYTGYLIEFDTDDDEWYITTNSGVKVFKFARAAGEATMSGLTVGIVTASGKMTATGISVGVTLKPPHGTVKSATCNPGEIFVDLGSDIDGSVFFCRADGTWKDIDDD